MSKILTIGIPTFNRASFLDLCLDNLFLQVKAVEQYISVYVADNASTDNTTEIVEKYCKLGFSINYYKQEKNLGMDGNFISLYEKCDTRYFWLLSDDDFLFPDSLKQIVELLKTEDLGVLHLASYWYDDIVDYDKVGNTPFQVVKYTQPIEFVERVNYWITFISGNIINKLIVPTRVDPYTFSNTYLSQLSWILPAVFGNKPNYVIEKPVIACKSNNSGGYKLIQIFGVNLNFILDTLIKNGYDKRIKLIINNKLLDSFFPMFLNRKNSVFDKEKYFTVLLSVFWRYRKFWSQTFPFLLKRKIGLLKVHD